MRALTYIETDMISLATASGLPSWQNTAATREISLQTTDGRDTAINIAHAGTFRTDISCYRKAKQEALYLEHVACVVLRYVLRFTPTIVIFPVPALQILSTTQSCASCLCYAIAFKRFPALPCTPGSVALRFKPIVHSVFFRALSSMLRVWLSVVTL